MTDAVFPLDLAPRPRLGPLTPSAVTFVCLRSATWRSMHGTGTRSGLMAMELCDPSARVLSRRTEPGPKK